MNASKMQKFYKAIVITIALVFLTSCSTILNGSSQNVSIVSEPIGAEVIINGVSRGKTPINQISLKRGEVYNIQFKKAGYKTTNFVTEKSFETACWGNLCLGGLPGAIVDIATGSAYKIVPDVIQVNLENSKDGSELNFKINNETESIEIYNANNKLEGKIQLQWY